MQSRMHSPAPSLPARSSRPTRVAGILTALGAVAAIAITAMYGTAGILLLAASVPLPLVTLWKVAGDEG